MSSGSPETTASGLLPGQSMAGTLMLPTPVPCRVKVCPSGSKHAHAPDLVRRYYVRPYTCCTMICRPRSRSPMPVNTTDWTASPEDQTRLAHTLGNEICPAVALFEQQKPYIWCKVAFWIYPATKTAGWLAKAGFSEVRRRGSHPRSNPVHRGASPQAASNRREKLPVGAWSTN